MKEIPLSRRAYNKWEKEHIYELLPKHELDWLRKMDDAKRHKSIKNSLKRLLKKRKDDFQCREHRKP